MEGRKKVVFVMEQSEMRDLCSEVGGRKEVRRWWMRVWRWLERVRRW